MTAHPRCGPSAACAAGPTPGPATRPTEVTSDRTRHNQDDAGAADGHAAGPGSRPGPGRRARRVHPPGAAAPHQPRHRRRWTRCSSPAGTPWPRSARRAPSGPGRCGPRSAGKAGTSRTNPTSPRTRPPRTSNGGSCCAPKPSSYATPRRRPEQDTTDFDELITELDEEITKAGIRGKVNPGRPGPAAPLHPPPPGCPGPAPPQGQPPDGRQDLHRPGRQDVPAVDVRHADLPELRAGRRGRSTCRPGRLRL